eukprot:TCALIF_05726-PB protein Name:"Protein of unknown function" AED:0.05 eAED:0.05 QI:1639/0.8/1/1/0.6/0.66/6/1342/45
MDPSEVRQLKEWITKDHRHIFSHINWKILQEGSFEFKVFDDEEEE